MTAKYHPELVQGSDEWHAARCGLLTASEMELIITPTLKIASNDKEKNHLYELLAQRITRYVEPSYIGDNMLRGWEDEIIARDLYSKTKAKVQEVGFITNDKFGFTIGYSPDGLVGDDGLVECKSRKQKFQVQAIIENLGVDGGATIPKDFVIQCQTGLMVSERKWLDFVSFSAGLPLVIIRVRPDPVVQDTIIEAATAFEARLAEKLAIYQSASVGLLPTERRIEQEMYV